jgi:hypothetical protein
MTITKNIEAFMKAIKSCSNVVKHGIFIETDTGERIELDVTPEVFEEALQAARNRSKTNGTGNII